ncbi:MAG: hypothetical protein R3C11_24125 [Planctomycetaceae bacterium]
MQKKTGNIKSREFRRYYENLRLCNLDQPVTTPKAFLKTQEKIRQLQASTQQSLAGLNKQLSEELLSRRGVERELESDQTELKALQQRKSNLPERFINIRRNLCEHLNLNDKELPFVAELVAVKEEDQAWTASIEMVLHSFALSLLVPEKYYPQVRAWVEQNRIVDARGKGQRLDYLCVGKAAPVSGDRIDPQALINKLQFRPHHHLVPWVRDEIQNRFNFICCNTVDEFNQISHRAMTTQRHVKFSPERHQKDDREHRTDPRHFVLGWDNTSKNESWFNKSLV